MGEATWREMMRLVEAYAAMMKQTERGDATEKQCDELWETIRRIAAGWEQTAHQCQKFWEEMSVWRETFVCKDGLAYSEEHRAIVHMDTETPYMERRKYPTPNAKVSGGGTPSAGLPGSAASGLEKG